MDWQIETRRQEALVLSIAFHAANNNQHHVIEFD
jgi:hypothetical protein